jgi:hypothetical protein
MMQKENGEILEILVIACNGTAAWQESLIHAIRDASPLPAPPDRAVFSNALVMEFVGFPYTTESDTQEYQPE